MIIQKLLFEWDLQIEDNKDSIPHGSKKMKFCRKIMHIAKISTNWWKISNIVLIFSPQKKPKISATSSTLAHDIVAIFGQSRQWW